VFVAAGSSTLPFAAPGSYAAGSPFNSSVASMSTFGIDSCSVDFINTQSPINCQGRLEVSFFYEPPNATWVRSTTTGNYNYSAISITDTEITNNIGYVKRFSNAEMTRLTRIGTVIPEQDLNTTVSSMEYTNPGSEYFNNMPFIIMKWNGCSASTAIGTIFVTLAISFEPVAAQRGIFAVQPRGSYEGTYRVFKQARKLGVPL
jgi:hypothetical protein